MTTYPDGSSPPRPLRAVTLTDEPPMSVGLGPTPVAPTRVAWDLVEVVRGLGGHSYGLRVAVVADPEVPAELAALVARRLEDRGSAVEIALAMSDGGPPARSHGASWPRRVGTGPAAVEAAIDRAEVVVDLGDGRADLGEGGPGDRYGSGATPGSAVAPGSGDAPVAGAALASSAAPGSGDVRGRASGDVRDRAPGRFRRCVAGAIEHARRRGALVVAGGLPTGVAASGVAAEGAVHAHTTVVWGAAPRAALLYPGRGHVGRVVVRDLASPQTVPGWQALTAAGASPGAYDLNTDKQDRGTVLAIAGSRQSAGAASATGTAALSSGAGLVAVATPEPVHLVLAMQHPGLRVRALPSKDGRLAAAAIAEVAEEVERHQVVVAGPGLSPEPEVRRLVDLLRARANRLVLDADALTVHHGAPEALADHVGDLVLTPNAAELSGLGESAAGARRRHADATAERAPELAERYGATIVAKGTRTVVASPDGRVWVTPTGNPALSTGGSGDVLAGMVAAAIAGADDVPLAVARAAWWHGMLGDLAAQQALGRASATDLLDRMPGVFGRIGELAQQDPLFPFTDRLVP